MAKALYEFENYYDEYLMIRTEYSEKTFHKVDACVLRKFRLVFGSCLTEIYQWTNDVIPLDSNLSPKEIERQLLIFRFGDKFVEFSASEFASFNLLK